MHVRIRRSKTYYQMNILSYLRGMILSWQIVLAMKASGAWVIDDLEPESHLGFAARP